MRSRRRKRRNGTDLGEVRSSSEEKSRETFSAELGEGVAVEICSSGRRHAGEGQGREKREWLFEASFEKNRIDREDEAELIGRTCLLSSLGYLSSVPDPTGRESDCARNSFETNRRRRVDSISTQFILKLQFRSGRADQG